MGESFLFFAGLSVPLRDIFTRAPEMFHRNFLGQWLGLARLWPVSVFRTVALGRLCREITML